MKFIILVATILLSTLGFSQSQTIFKNLNAGESKTITVSTATYSSSDVGGLKDELLEYKEGIIHVDYNENSETFTVTYNSKMSIKKLATLFDKYRVSYDINISNNITE
jgi:hypothetical protein